MKSSKMENLYEINPAIEESKNLSPLTYYQPFRSSFDPSFRKPSATPSTGEPSAPEMQEKMWTAPQKLYENSRKGSLMTNLNSGEQIQASKIFKNPCLGGVSPKHRDNIFAQRFPSCSRHWNANPSWSERKICTPNERKICEGRNLHQYSSVPTNIQSDCSLKKNFSENTQGNLNFRNCNASDLTLKSLLVSSRQSNFDMGGTVKNPTCHTPGIVSSSKAATHNLCESGYSRITICNFCKNNKEVPDIYLNHNLYDPETKKLTCPVLRKHVCGICGETGDRAHTLQYCPVNRQRGLQAKVPVLLKTRTITNSTGKIRKN